MMESILDNNYSLEENKALEFLINWEIDDSAPADYLEHRSDDHKLLDLAILYLYRLKIRTFIHYFNQVQDKSLFDDADEMIRLAFEYKFSK